LGIRIHDLRMNGRKFGPTCGFYIILSHEKVLKTGNNTTRNDLPSNVYQPYGYLLHRLYAVIEVRECFLLFGAESFVFQFAIQKFKD